MQNSAVKRDVSAQGRAEVAPAVHQPEWGVAGERIGHDGVAVEAGIGCGDHRRDPLGHTGPDVVHEAARHAI